MVIQQITLASLYFYVHIFNPSNHGIFKVPGPDVGVQISPTSDIDSPKIADIKLSLNQPFLKPLWKYYLFADIDSFYIEICKIALFVFVIQRTNASIFAGT